MKTHLNWGESSELYPPTPSKKENNILKVCVCVFNDAVCNACLYLEGRTKRRSTVSFLSRLRLPWRWSEVEILLKNEVHIKEEVLSDKNLGSVDPRVWLWQLFSHNSIYLYIYIHTTSFSHCTQSYRYSYIYYIYLYSYIYIYMDLYICICSDEQDREKLWFNCIRWQSDTTKKKKKRKKKYSNILLQMKTVH